MYQKIITFLIVFNLSIFVYGQNKKSKVVEKPIEKLNFLVGDWELKSFIFNQKGEWVYGDTTSSKITKILDGAALMEDVEFKLPDVNFRVNIVFSYDKFREVYRLSVVDKGQGLMDIYEGNFKDGSIMLDNLRSKTFFPLANGKKLFSRITYTKPIENSFVLFLDISTDEGKVWSKYMKVIYKRKTKDKKTLKVMGQ